MSSAHYEQLLRQYIHICNKALIHNRNKFPYNQLLQMVQKAPPVSVVLVDDTPKGLFELSVDSSQIQAKNIGDDAPTEQVIRLKVSDLEHVVNNPDEYIKNPAQIDWDWLRDQHSADG